MSVILGIAAAMGAGLWYTSERAYYQEVSGITEVMAYGDAFPVRNYRGIDADTSPLKIRACFDVDWDYWPSDEFKDVAVPLNAPRWFDCFDARQIGEDIQAGVATAILSDENNPYGFDTFIAQYEDGRAYLWRQINTCGEAQFGGDSLPEGCPKPEGDMQKKPGVTSGGIGPVDVKIALTLTGSDDIEPIAIRNAVGTSDNADPDSFWACFEVELSIALVTETFETTDDVRPRNPVSSLECFDAETIRDDVYSGAAIAVVGQRFIGVDRIVAIYQDGRAFAWHQRAK